MLEKFNEINNVYGKLTVIKRGKNSKNGNAYWICLCNCGNLREIEVRAGFLRSGHTKSCGCLVIEANKRVHIKKIVSEETKKKMRKPKGIRMNGRSELGKKYPENGDGKGSLMVRKVNSFLTGVRTNNHDCNLSKEQIAELFTMPCVYCNKESDLLEYKGGTGIDRLDNEKGYIEGNCVPSCCFCNICKNERTLDEFKQHIENMYNTLIRDKKDVKASY